jgi:hypothetical protein
VPDDLYGPLRPSAWWTLAGLALILVVVVWFSWVLWSTRRPRGSRRGSRRDVVTSLAEQRAEALGAIDELEAAHDAGRLDARQLFQQLSPLVRRYVHATSGRPAHVSALTDLGDDDPALAATVAWLYPEEFAADAPGAVAEGLARTRWYVATHPEPVVHGEEHRAVVHR